MKKFLLFLSLSISAFSQEIQYKDIPYIESFIENTGEKQERLNQFIKTSIIDKNLVLAIESFKNTTVKTKYGESIDYPTIMSHLLDSTKTGNALSAHAGILIFQNIFQGKGTSDSIREAIPVMSKLLAENGYCMGYMYYGDSFTLNLTNTPDYTKARKVYELGLSECIEPKSSWFKSELKSRILKMNVILKLKKEGRMNADSYKQSGSSR